MSLLYVYVCVCVCVQIQYTSDTDGQWKFPLVSELSTGVLMASRTLGSEASGLDYRVFRYEKLETLLLFRTSRTYVMQNLLPRGEAQALHPLPFPQTSRLEEDYRLQIYNAAWNGLLLGYPPRFVENYCVDFHNDLSVTVKKQLYQRARGNLHRFLGSINQTMELIHLGRDEAISDDTWDFISTFIQ